MVNANLGLGRLYIPDEGDAAYAIEIRRLPPRPVKRVTKHWPLFRRALHQGNEGICVGHGCRTFLDAAPTIQLKHTDEPLARTIYMEAIKLDEWPANDWGDPQSGTSVRAGLKALKARGLITEYNMTNSVHTMADWLGGKDETGRFIGGPLVIGVNWYESMQTPSRDGYVHSLNGRILGGHCFTIIGWSEGEACFVGMNSHGNSYGKNGRVKIPAEVMDRLMREDGEAWTAVEVRRTA